MPNNNLEHIAFILDGNKRWAKKNNINLKNAYKAGLENISNLIDDCLKIKLKYSTKPIIKKLPNNPIPNITTITLGTKLSVISFIDVAA